MPPPRNARKLFRSAKVKLQCVAAFKYSRAYKAEGDPSLNTPEAKLIRDRMFMHEELQSRFRRFWSGLLTTSLTKNILCYAMQYRGAFSTADRSGAAVGGLSYICGAATLIGAIL